MIFTQLPGFGRIHHRFLNDLSLLAELAKNPFTDPEFTDLAEGDLCWYIDGTTVHAVMLHPSNLNRIPEIDQIHEDLRRGKILRLEDILDEDFRNVPLVVELKTGKGDTKRALEHVLSLLEEKAQGRYWVDSFSPALLASVKAISPATPTSLHTRLGVYGSIIIKTNFEILPLTPTLVSRLPQADAITVTYKYSPARYLKRLGVTVDSIHRRIIQEGKRLVLGGIDSKEVFDEVRHSLAVAAYVKWSPRK